MRIAIIGCGSIGLRHTENLLRLRYRNLVVCDPRAERRRLVAERFRLPVVPTLAQAFRDHVDVAFITSPTHLHLGQARDAVRRGAHVFIEKPLAHVADRRVTQLLVDARRRRRTVFVAVNIRFHPGPQLLKRLLDRGAIGPVRSARVEAGFWLPDWHPGQDYRRWYMAKRSLGGGALLDGIHEIDYLCWLLGDPLDVTAVAERVSDLAIDTEDIGELLLRFKSGAVGNVHVDYLQRAYTRTCRLIGARGTLTWDFTQHAVRWYSARTKRWKTFRYPAGDLNAMYVEELKHFFRLLRRRERPDGREGLRALQVAEAARRSARTGRRVRLGDAR